MPPALAYRSRYPSTPRTFCSDASGGDDDDGGGGGGSGGSGGGSGSGDGGGSGDDGSYTSSDTTDSRPDDRLDSAVDRLVARHQARRRDFSSNYSPIILSPITPNTTRAILLYLHSLAPFSSLFFVAHHGRAHLPSQRR